jgi:hypothetical protein
LEGSWGNKQAGRDVLDPGRVGAFPDDVHHPVCKQAFLGQLRPLGYQPGSEHLHRDLSTLLRICAAHGLRHDGMQVSERQFHPGIPQGSRIRDETRNHSRTQECANGPAPPGEIAMRAAGGRWERDHLLA